MTQTTTARLTLNPVQVFSVHDADTLRVAADLPAIWPDIVAFHPDIRVAHCNAAELSTQDGKDALLAVTQWLSTNGPDFALHVYGRDKYGRLLADLEGVKGSLSAYVLTLPGSVPLSIKEALAR